jgi:hypothetical protein
MGHSEGRDASYTLAKAVMGRYVESYFPGIRKHQVVLERGVEAAGENLRRRMLKRSGSRSRKGEKDALDSAGSSLVREVGLEWMVWSNITPPAVALYAWWVVFAIWRKLDDGEQDFLAQFTTNRDKVKTWLKWAFVGLAGLLCVLALVIWAAVKAIRLFSGSKLSSLPSEGNN